MSSQHIRPWLAAAVRCSRYSLLKPPTPKQLRTLTTEAPRRLETAEDWAELTKHREQLGLLSASTYLRVLVTPHTHISFSQSALAVWIRPDTKYFVQAERLPA